MGIHHTEEFIVKYGAFIIIFFPPFSGFILSPTERWYQCTEVTQQGTIASCVAWLIKYYLFQRDTKLSQTQLLNN